MGAVPTTVAIFTPEEWAERLLRLYPSSWTSDAAKAAGGILYTLFQAQSTPYEFLENGLDWLLQACRIATASDVALDAIAKDYFGSVSSFEAIVVRYPGEPDETFRQRIYANLLQGGGTRSDIKRVIELLTGREPRIIEPWNVLDTSACDTISYCDIDTVANPSRTADINLPFQGLVESVLPSFGDQGNNPVYCVDVGASCDRSFILDPKPTWFLGEKDLDQAINRVRMANTIVWRKYGSSLNAGYERGNSGLPLLGDLTLPVILFPAASDPLVVLSTCLWNSTVWANVISDSSFVLGFGTPAPGGLAADWIAAPVTVPGFGRLPLSESAEEASISTPIEDYVVLATPSWNTSIWLIEAVSGSTTFAFSTPAPIGAVLNYGSFSPERSGTVEVTEDDLTPVEVTFSVPEVDAYQLQLLASWNTQFIVSKTLEGFTVEFSVPPPADAFFCWGTFNQPF